MFQFKPVTFENPPYIYYIYLSTYLSIYLSRFRYQNLYIICKQPYVSAQMSESLYHMSAYIYVCVCVRIKCQNASNKPCTLKNLRFGVALSAIRTQHYEQNIRRAMKFLRKAKATTSKLDERARINNLWIQAADLKPVLSYLSSHRPWTWGVEMWFLGLCSQRVSRHSFFSYAACFWRGCCRMFQKGIHRSELNLPL